MQLKKTYLLTLLVLFLGTIAVTETGCSSQKKGYNYSAHNKRNKAANRSQSKRFKKAGGDQLKFSCPKFKKN
jgi:hypothetical protein